jgi:thiol:disulfide interchange protein
LLILWLVALLTGHPRAWAAMDVTPQQTGTGSTTTYAPPHNYDPAHDPEKDLAAAGAEAKNSNRYIFAVVGGEWCSWCHIMDDFFREHANLAALRDKNYVLMKINMSQENPNRAFLARYPKISGYPHIFILDADGKLIQSQATSTLEDGRSYNLKRFEKFLEKFGPKNGSMTASRR